MSNKKKNTCCALPAYSFKCDCGEQANLIQALRIEKLEPPKVNLYYLDAEGNVLQKLTGTLINSQFVSENLSTSERQYPQYKIKIEYTNP